MPRPNPTPDLFVQPDEAAAAVDAALRVYLDRLRQLKACHRAVKQNARQVIVHPPLPTDPVTGKPVKRGQDGPQAPQTGLSMCGSSRPLPWHESAPAGAAGDLASLMPSGGRRDGRGERADRTRLTWDRRGWCAAKPASPTAGLTYRLMAPRSCLRMS